MMATTKSVDFYLGGVWALIFIMVGVLITLLIVALWPYREPRFAHRLDDPLGPQGPPPSIRANDPRYNPPLSDDYIEEWVNRYAPELKGREP